MLTFESCHVVIQPFCLPLFMNKLSYSLSKDMKTAGYCVVISDFVTALIWTQREDVQYVICEHRNSVQYYIPVAMTIIIY